MYTGQERERRPTPFCQRTNPLADGDYRRFQGFLVISERSPDALPGLLHTGTLWKGINPTGLFIEINASEINSAPMSVLPARKQRENKHSTADFYDVQYPDFCFCSSSSFNLIFSTFDTFHTSLCKLWDDPQGCIKVGQSPTFPLSVRVIRRVRHMESFLKTGSLSFRGSLEGKRRRK